MILKDKGEMSGRELCDVEGIIFPYLAELDGMDKEKSKKAAINMINENWESILVSCYLNDDGTEITDTEINARMMIIQDFPSILEFVISIDQKKGSQAKPPGKHPRQIKRR